jgi:hypothetical protein
MEWAIKFMKDPLKVGLAMKTPAKQKLEQLVTSDEKIMMDMAKIEANAALLHITQSEKDEWTTIIPTDLLAYIETLSDTTTNVISDISDLHSLLERLPTLEDLSSDFTDVSSALTGLKASLGQNSLGLYPDVWTAVNEINSTNQLYWTSLNFCLIEGFWSILGTHIVSSICFWKESIWHWMDGALIVMMMDGEWLLHMLRAKLMLLLPLRILMIIQTR